MAAEWRESPQVVSRQSRILESVVSKIGTFLRNNPPRVVVTCARGSSRHAASFGKYLIERHLGLPVATASPSITTVYKKRLDLDGQLFLAISQSGSSDDLVEATQAAKAAGALTIGIVNELGSPLAAACEIVLPMVAGQEKSVAATKSFIASLTTLLHLIGAWAKAPELQSALERLPDRLQDASVLDWSSVIEMVGNAESLVALGRGPTDAIALEASLKLKEVCHIHAEAFSGAEFQHGPIALVSGGYPVLVFMPSDSSATPLRSVVADLSHKKAMVLVTGDCAKLPVLASDCAETDGICLIQTFYGLAIQVARYRGIDVDQPRHLQKITRTR
jgi:glucosamine--fructose-6-phosphate aminotransferase (isomerizing)